ncbi:MAG TPA: hypothetical protein VFM93_06765 [Candidatus Limnocylindria bacterium]|nr:hypothetical protein [Candidatus Limnocylindria bacterium]
MTLLLDSIGRERTAIVVYLLERSWQWLIVATALTPVFVWTLGSSAVHAAATLGGARGASFAPMLVLFGYATALARVPADVVAIVVPALGGLAGAAATLWLGVVAWRGIGAHYGQPSQRALVTLAVAIVLFYLVPLVLIGLAVLAILIAAIVLEYVPAT